MRATNSTPKTLTDDAVAFEDCEAVLRLEDEDRSIGFMPSSSTTLRARTSSFSR